MKFIILFGIRLYWLVIPKRKRKPCVFKESCSHYVYNVTRQFGFKKGVQSYFLRKKQCRKGYVFYFSDNGNILIQLADGTKIDGEQVSETLVEEISIFKRHLKEVKLSDSVTL